MVVLNSLQHYDIFAMATTYVTTAKAIKRCSNFCICKHTWFKLWWNQKNIVH